LTSESCWRYIGFVLDQLPIGAQLAIGTRSDPPLPLARLAAAGRLHQVRQNDLAMSRGEAQEMLRLHQHPLDDETLDALLRVTEGWATGLYLALLAGERAGGRRLAAARARQPARDRRLLDG